MKQLNLLPVKALMILFAFFMVSCGDDDSEEINENPLVGKWHYYKEGKLIDYERFEKNGERSKEMLGLAYLQKDSVLLGSDLQVQFRLGNVSDSIYLKGWLVITSKFDQNGNPTDTIDLIESHNNSYIYTFEAKNVGLNHLKGCLQYIIPLDTVDADLVHQYCFKEPYFVEDLK